MKSITIKRNVKAKVPLLKEVKSSKEFALKHKPALKPQSKRAKVKI